MTDRISMEIINFLVEKAKNVDSPFNLADLAREFKIKFMFLGTEKFLRLRIDGIRSRIHESLGMSVETKIRLLFALRAPIDDCFLHELKAHGSVTLNESNQIIKYKSNDGNLELNGSLRADEQCSFRDFILNSCKIADSPLNGFELCREYKEKSGTKTKFDSLTNSLKKYRKSLQNREFIDKNEKMRQLFVLSARLDSEYLEELRKEAVIEVDNKNRIKKYTSNDGSLELGQNRRENSQDETESVFLTNYQLETKELIDFIAKKCEKTTFPLSRRQLSQEYKTKSECSAPLTTIISRLERYCRNFQKNEEFDNTKIKEMFALSITVNTTLLAKFRKTAMVNLDNRRRIVEYKANDGSLTLQMDNKKSLMPMEIDLDEGESSDEEETIESASRKRSHRGRRIVLKRESESDGNSMENKSDASRTEPDDLESLEIENMEKKPTILLNIRDEDVEPMDIESVEREEVDKTASSERVEPMEQDNIEKKPTILLPSIAASLESTLADSSINNSGFIISQDTFSVQNGLSGVASPLQSVTETRESIMDKEKLISVSDHINFLESIKNVITTLDIPNLKMLESRIEKKIQKMKESGNKEEEVTLMELRASISTCLLIIQKNSIKELSNGETTTSVKEFLLILRTSLIRINIPILDQSQHQVKKWIQRISDQVSTISIDKLQSSLQSLLDLVAP